MNKIIKLMENQFQKNNIKIFSLSDLELLSGMKEQSLRVQLSRLFKSDDIQRVAKGYYRLMRVNWKWSDLLPKLVSNSYVSGKYVLSKSGICLLRTSDITVISSEKMNRYIQTERGMLKFRQDSNFNYSGVANNVANNEKALVDFIRITLLSETRNPEFLFNERAWNNYGLFTLDWVKIQEYGKKTKNSVQLYLDKVYRVLNDKYKERVAPGKT